MKNIHILPTDKPSNIYKTDKLYKYINGVKREPLNCINQNIYITSDEEIKEGDYAIYLFDNTINRIQIGINYSNPKSHKKIILTTDQSLNGVQAIDDEFLEWFVKNPSCEEVEVQSWKIDKEWDKVHTQFNPIYPMKTKYKIIIPIEEPTEEAKQRAANYMRLKGALDSQYVDFSNPNADKITSASTITIKQEILEEPKALTKLEIAKNIAAIGIGKKEAPKQETLEEVKPKDIQRIISSTDAQSASIEIVGLFNKWQQERMYSEEDIENAFYAGLRKAYSPKKHSVCWKEWFEQFKKK